MTNKKIGPTCVSFFGREELLNDVVIGAFRSRCALLFGGRQAGKTTLLVAIKDTLSFKVNLDELTDVDIPVYINLMTLPFDATPSDFFKKTVISANKACASMIEGYQGCSLIAQLPESRMDIEAFVKDFETLFSSTGEVNIRFLLLVDEAKRILGDRFPRGFQDNLFTLLYGTEFSITGKIGIVFAGAQDLYKLSEDDTSPIASRAEAFYIKNLTKKSVSGMVNEKFPNKPPEEIEKISEVVFEFTGGHAGLTSKALALVDGTNRWNTPTESEVLIEELKVSCSQLLGIWTVSLSPEARAACEAIATSESINMLNLGRKLKSIGIDPISARKAVDELEFTGICYYDGENMYKCNRVYWDACGELLACKVDESNPAVWSLIEKTEITLKELIKKKFEEKWALNGTNKIKEILGAEHWKKINNNLSKSKYSYPLSKNKEQKSIFECLYFGHLIALMVGKQSWPLFSHLFRDKRQLEDLFAAISPVRNDHAHFANVPLKELDRCRIACDDLLVICERETNLP